MPIKSIGIDVGVKSFAVLSDGTIIDNPRYLTKSEKKLIRKQRELSRKKKGSSTRVKARRTVASLHRKVKNQRSDFQHKVSRYIVDNYGFIAVENLNIRNMVRNRHLAKSISDLSVRLDGFDQTKLSKLAAISVSASGGSASGTGTPGTSTAAKLDEKTKAIKESSAKGPDWDLISAQIGSSVGSQLVDAMKKGQVKFEFSPSSPGKGILSFD